MPGRLKEPSMRALLVSLLATLLFAGAARAFFSTVYYKNLATLEINSSVLYALLLLAPAVYVLPRVAARPRLIVAGAVVAIAAGRLLMGVTWGGDAYLPIAGLTTAAYLVLLPALLRWSASEGGDAGPAYAAVGAALGWAADAALLVAGDSWDATAGARGLPLAALLAALLLIVALAPGLRRASGGVPQASSPTWLVALAGLGVGAWLFLQHAVLASPYSLARWNDVAVLPLAFGIVIGLALPGALAFRESRLATWPFVAANAGALLAVLDHAFVHSDVLPLLVVVAQAALVLDAIVLFGILGSESLRAAGLAVLLGAFATLVLHFGFAFAFTFAYVPLGDLWEGSEVVLVPLAFVLVAAPALVALRVGGAAPPRVPRVAAPRAAVAVLLVLPLVLMAGAFALPDADVDAPPADEPITVLAFNVHQGFDNRGVLNPQIFVDLLRDLDPDVVALQESDTPRFTSGNVDVVTYLAENLGYHVAYGPASSEQSFGVGLLSRYPIESSAVVRIPSPADNRFFLEADVDVDGRTVRVFVVHLGLPEEGRTPQSRDLLARASESPHPVIFAGDFNSCPGGICPDYEGPRDTVYQRVTDDYVDAWVAGGNGADDAAGYTYEARDPTERIDYVFVSSEFDVVRVERVRSEAAVAASDHLPVLAELRLS